MRGRESCPGVELLRTAAHFVLLATALLLGSAPIQGQSAFRSYTSSVAFQEPGWELAPESTPGLRPKEDAWRAVQLPAPFEHELGTDFDGVVWYRNDLGRAAVRPGAPIPRWRLEFRAAATEATVYWNGERLGSHVGGWTPFEVELPMTDDGALEGRLEVRVDELVGHDTQGFLPIIQPHFGGLWQEVLLWREEGPTIDRSRVSTFGDLLGERLLFDVPVRGLRSDQPLDLVVGLTLDQRSIRELRVPVPDDGRVQGHVDVPDPKAWAPGSPTLYGVTFWLERRSDGERLDGDGRRVGFRHVSTDGTRLLWNGMPLQVRGMLHWGYSPPGLAPEAESASLVPLERWRRELELVRDLGCNLVKCCLWVPPESYYEIADELGILVWQEYPTWHAKLLEERLPALEREFAEFFRHDRDYASVAFRSLTCESGSDVDPAVLERLYALGHELVPNSLIIDNSSWISWMRVHDFWDDHPYGNNGWWPQKLAEIERFVAEREAKPVLFGECIASDTWFDREAWDAAQGDERRWYEPWCLAAQRDFEHELRERWGDELVRSLLPVSKRYALRNRKYQCERMRLDLPEAGYVLSVIRDFPKARMGFLDDLDRPKWSPDEWAWHGDLMLCLDTEGDRRAFLSGETFDLRLFASNFGPDSLMGFVRYGLRGPGASSSAAAIPTSSPQGEVVRVGGQNLRFEDVADVPQQFQFWAQLDEEMKGTPAHENEWDLWLLPRQSPAPNRDAVRIADRLDTDLLVALEAGADVLLRAHPGEGSFKTSGLWFLKGAPWAPAHPINEHVPRELLYDLQGFDLEQPFVLHGEHLFDQVDPILGFWDTHDIRGVNRWLLAFETRVGAGRLLVSALDHETPAGEWVESEFVRHLAGATESERALTAETVAALRAALAGETIELATWRFRTDPDDVGRDLGWQTGLETTDGWRDMPAGRHWESEGVSYDGAAWYAIDIEVPESWSGRDVHAVFDGVDDSYHLYCNGQLVARHGDPETGETVWLERTTGELTDAIECGATNRLVLRVVDHTGAGGLHRKATVTTGWTEGGLGAELLN